MRIFKKIYEIFFCLILAANLSVVLFDSTYLMKIPYTYYTFRDIYRTAADRYEILSFLKHPSRPGLLFYDDVKGIDAHRATASFLADFDRLEKILNRPEEKQPEVPELLGRLSSEMVRMIDQDPYTGDFALAEKNGTLEEIKNRIRAHYRATGTALHEISAKDSFRRFFSAENLTPAMQRSELAFFNVRLRPLFEQNYHRWIDIDGEQKDFFTRRIDLWFLLFFWCDFIARWVYAVFARSYRRWYLFPIRRWVEIFNLISLHHTVWTRILRVVPLFNRLKENGFLPGEGIMPGLIHENAEIIAEEISGMVFVNILDQTQSIIRSGDFNQIGDINESGIIAEIRKFTNTNIGLIGQSMIPAIEPDIARLIEFSVNSAMKPYLNSPVGFPVRMLLRQVYSGLHDGLRAALSSPEGMNQIKNIMQKAVDTIIAELTADRNVAVMQEEVAALLEAVKNEVNRAIQQRG